MLIVAKAIHDVQKVREQWKALVICSRETVHTALSFPFYPVDLSQPGLWMCDWCVGGGGQKGKAEGRVEG